MDDDGNYCPGCGDPNGTPCFSCGYGVRHKTTAPAENKPDTSADIRQEK